MTIQKREFALEFKREAVALLESSGRPTSQIAAEIGIMPSMLRAWRRKVNGESTSSTIRSVSSSPLPSPADQAAQIAKLKRELGRAQMERDVLKKAIGIFAEVPK
jgi:transposase